MTEVGDIFELDTEKFEVISVEWIAEDIEVITAKRIL